MHIPYKVKIGGYTYDVKFDSKLTRDTRAQGTSCPNGLEIVIDSNLPTQNQESVLLHEIIESINFHYDLGFEHNVIMILESALYQVIKDNPDIFKE